MAKKKSSPSAVTAYPAAATAAPLPGEPWTNTVENLRNLNHLLLKETTEQRKRVKDFQSHLDDLSTDHSLSSDLERGVTRLVVASRLAELAAQTAGAEERARSAEAALVIAQLQWEWVARENDAIEKALDKAIVERDAARVDLEDKKCQAEAQVAAVREEIEGLRSDHEQGKAYIRSLEADNTTLGERISSMEESLRNANDQLQLIEGEKVGIEKDLELAILLRDACKGDLEAMLVALQNAKGMINSSRAVNDAPNKEITKMQLDFAEQKRTFIRQIDELVERIHGIECKTEELEGEKGILESEITDLQGRVSELRATEQEKIDLEEKLSLAEEALRSANARLDFVTVEKDNAKKALDQAISERDSNQRKLAEEDKLKAVLTKETEKLMMEFGSLEKEKERLQLEIEAQKRDYSREFDGLMDTMKKIEVEKDAIDGLRAKQEVEITDLQREVSNLLSGVSELQELCRANTENNAQLQAEKESALGDLGLEKAEVRGLRLQIEELNKNKDDAHDELMKIKASLDRLSTENENIKIDFDSLTREKASLGEKLRNTLQVVQELEGKARAADKNVAWVLYLLNSTSAVVNGLEQCKENGDGREIDIGQELDENIQDIAAELEAIKMAFRSRVVMIGDMDRELRLLRCAVAETKKKGGAWTWFCPTAATFLAAITFVYAAMR